MTNFANVAIKLCLACSLQDINVNAVPGYAIQQVMILLPINVSKGCDG